MNRTHHTYDFYWFLPMGNHIKNLNMKRILSLLYTPLVAVLFSQVQSQRATPPAISTDPSYYYNLCAPSTCSNLTLPYPFTLPKPCHPSLIQVACPSNHSVYISSPRIAEKYKILSLDSSDPGTLLVSIAAEGLFTCGAQISTPNRANDYTMMHSNYTFGTHFNCTRPIPSNSVPGLQNASCIGCEGQDPSNICYYVSGFVAAPIHCEKFHIFTPGNTFNASSVSNLRAFLQLGFPIKYTKTMECRGCEASGGRCGLHPLSGEDVCFCSSSVHSTNCTDGLVLDLSTWTNSSRKGKSKPSRVVIAVSSSALVVIVGAFAALVIIYIRRRKLNVGIDKGKISSISPTRYTYSQLKKFTDSFSPIRIDKENISSISPITYTYSQLKKFTDSFSPNGIDKENISSISPIRYTYSQLKKFTDSFSTKIGEGGFGSVYKGTIYRGGLELPVAVKVLKQTRQTKIQFMNEVRTIGNVHHHNLVSMLGYCVEGKTHALVYEFMENGSLDKYIYKLKKGTDDVRCGTVTHHKQLNSKEMYDIALGTARGILYLHNGCGTKVLHCDIKPSNILLDSNFSAKIADFGLAKMIDKDHSHVSLSRIRGTPGYTAPETWLKIFGQVTEKSDVYSYGMLLLDIVGRRKNYDAEASGTSQVYFPEWLYNQVDKEETSLLIKETGSNDSFGDIQEEAGKVLQRMCFVGLWCIQHIPSKRPSMNNVIKMLEGHVEIEIPPYPFPQNSA